MFPNVQELTKAVQANTELMNRLLVEIQKMNSSTAKLIAAIDRSTASHQK